MTWTKFNNHKCFRQKSDKLLLVFPGIGYHDEKPLLYYPIKQAIALGYDILVVNYPQYEFSITKIEQYVNQVISEIDDVVYFMKRYDKTIVMAKSVGCLISKKLISSADKYLLLTPTSEAIPYLNHDDVVLMGDSDPLCVDYKAIKVKQLNLFKNANHSIEVSDDYLISIEYLYQVLAIIKAVLEE